MVITQLSLPLVAALVTGVSGCITYPDNTTSTSPDPTMGLGERQQVSVVRVVDGDTLIVNLAGRNERVRFIGINAPELARDGKESECYGPQAAEYLSNLLPPHTQIKIESDPATHDRDRYDRLLRTVFLPYGQNLSVLLTATGHAKTYLYNNTSTRYETQIVTAEQQAKTSKQGLWGTCLGT
ncbi:thermonuclease family protein [Acaricomes phytoseiuli]|uniref:thermonuclease family protein n=1 Tax=Acaricomes phytoseiuli TaxID=291968 RepID=UPI002221C07D|nr:thermonuclease family protein [Acaricomes phytoseiuli]MCW1250548.1 thermonuclease family protein [Acaricomes phytoseiuli]